MATQGERQQGFLWRPNDNSATTRVRYDLEAEHWLRSFKSAERSQRTTSFSSDLSAIGLFIGLFFNLISIIFMIVIKVLKWIFNISSNSIKKHSEVKPEKRLTNEELRSKIESGNMKIVNVYEN